MIQTHNFQINHERNSVQSIIELRHLKTFAAIRDTGNLTRAAVELGIMIETPAAALLADQLAEVADFFSIGTNDLTQMGYGFSRDDTSVFVPEYISKKILEDDPFQSLDQQGIGELVKIAAEKGRSVKPDLKLGVCGEHGGDPSSIEFCATVGLNYVSCSPFRVPIARFAAAKAAMDQQ